MIRLNVKRSGCPVLPDDQFSQYGRIFKVSHGFDSLL